MRNGFTFKGRHSSEFGVTVKTKSRPLRPSVKTSLADLPCRDGVYDFSEANALGRECFNERTFVIEIAVMADDIYQMQDKLSALSLWLCGGGELIFDDMPLVKWVCKVSDEIIYMPERGGRKSVIEASMRAKPFGIAIFDSDGPEIGIDITLGTNIPIGLADMHTYSFSGSKNMTVVNWGDRPARPVMSISGASGNVSLSLGDKKLSFTCDGNVTVDFDKQSVTDSAGNYLAVSGGFFEFPPGGSMLKASGSGNIKAHMVFNPEFMYNLNIDFVDWGNEYA